MSNLEGIEYPQLKRVLSPVPPELFLEDRGKHTGGGGGREGHGGGGRDVVTDTLYGVPLALRGHAPSFPHLSAV